MQSDPARYSRRYEGVSRTGAPWAVDVLRERFLGPEIFFNPRLYSRNSGGGLKQRAGVGMHELREEDGAQGLTNGRRARRPRRMHSAVGLRPCPPTPFPRMLVLVVRPPQTGAPPCPR